ncbi:Undecaprenyl-diphosphatase [uncultured Clostridium sp.]|uniref:Undecaprenyl-diphosphatase n=1 Tax=Muricoprocola aceti TaxID=2981772 RepID=A0ABT2SLG1_9FIRM|nr:undecaprenyl-diphosphate phosphatase [Muricoprocola aceti]MCI7227126.1 undecaprenyl-diphosphate phosphatase [Lachnospiraceae bacterium]MCQ4773016.1 undecaprenyl-diphosphate phosphatase [Lacrimispora saccharolytica]SCH47715.1 Undecaprenyl-diphosphatase [uncultured Clostridium sp.]MCU6725342.1 undecaprenyl-diphosphate phosphatase [Muricoprocola aceti]MDD7437098.1 undecaprenyl-diphosphate phosphatase [Lachnospiraceae bacterium]
MEIIEILKAILFGIVEGITEWLPVSSTGHMILLDELVKLDVTDEFMSMFLVVIQLGAILAVVVLYFPQLWPFSTKERFFIKKDTFSMWFKILVACVPAAVVGILFEDELDRLFYNYWTVAFALIVFGVLFIIIEHQNKDVVPKVNSIAQITYPMAFCIGAFQLIAAVFPGTSRSGATILGAIMIGISRTVAAEFTFFLAVPVMLGASLLKILKFGLVFSASEVVLLLVGMVVAFVVSIVVIKLLLGYIRRHSFTVFGWYRIILGIVVLAFFLAQG